MKGFEALWIPGTDHAGIATQTVTEKLLMRTEGKTRHDLGREKFVERVWDWCNKYGGQILNQLKAMGCAVDWDRKFFTLDESRNAAVIEAFCRLAEKGIIYRMNRLVNWCSTLRTALSDIEVDHIEIKEPIILKVPGYPDGVEAGYLTHFSYKLKDSPDKEIIVATTRLETMLGDVAVAVHPEDERYKEFVGKELVHPFIKDRKMVVIADPILVDMKFGTGAVKITPAHDPNDFTCGERHKLEMINILNDDGTINKNGGEFEGMKRFDARKKIFEALEKMGQLKNKTKNPMTISVCQRSGDLIEPIIKPQWWVNTSIMAGRAVDAVKTGKLKILPEVHVKTWYQWLENARDWCISRQLWWGHRIPAYLCTVKGIIDKPDTNNQDHWIIAKSEEEAKKKAMEKYKVSEDKIILEQDFDVLDTWFSSGILPLSPLGWPNTDNKDFKAFYPTQLLETGSDILFFWVARMVMMSLTLHDSLPFTEVFLHNLVKDAQGKKMSKSKGNVIDPLEIIKGCDLDVLIQRIKDSDLPQSEIDRSINLRKKELPQGIPQCGSDALRFTLLAYMNQGTNINLDIKRVNGYRLFCNKLWNAIKFALTYLPPDFKPVADISILPLTFAEKWILSALTETARDINKHFEEFNFGLAMGMLHDFWLHKLCDVYLEAAKPSLQTKTDPKITNAAQNTLYKCLYVGLCLLHPAMPYITEELYQRLPAPETRADSIFLTQFPEFEEKLFNAEYAGQMDLLMNAVRSVRSMIATLNIPSKNKPKVEIACKEEAKLSFFENNAAMIGTLAKVGDTEVRKDHTMEGCIMHVLNPNVTIYLQVKGMIDIKAEIARLKKKIGQSEGFVKKIEQKIAVKDYEQKVPEDVRKENKEKLETTLNEIATLKKCIEDLEKMQ
jgi:valyl-tRNA synthetase